MMTRDTRITINCTEEFRRDLRITAAKQDMSMSEYTREAIREKKTRETDDE